MKALMLAAVLVVAGGGFLLAADDAQAAPPPCTASVGTGNDYVACRVEGVACVVVYHGDPRHCTP